MFLADCKGSFKTLPFSLSALFLGVENSLGFLFLEVYCSGSTLGVGSGDKNYRNVHEWRNLFVGIVQYRLFSFNASPVPYSSQLTDDQL